MHSTQTHFQDCAARSPHIKKMSRLLALPSIPPLRKQETDLCQVPSIQAPSSPPSSL